MPYSKAQDLTRKNFMQAFISLYREKPMDAISVTAITKRARYNRTTFYHYFEDTADLYRSLEDDIYNGIKENFDRNLKNIKKRDDFVKLFTEVFLEWREYMEVILGGSLRDEFTARVKELMIGFVIQSRNLRRDDVKLSYRLDFYISAIISVICRWLDHPEDMTVEELAGLIQEMGSNGVLNSL